MFIMTAQHACTIFLTSHSIPQLPPRNVLIKFPAGMGFHHAWRPAVDKDIFCILNVESAVLLPDQDIPQCFV